LYDGLYLSCRLSRHSQHNPVSRAFARRVCQDFLFEHGNAKITDAKQNREKQWRSKREFYGRTPSLTFQLAD